MSETKPQQRFTNRVEDYVRFRPGYPPEFLSFLKKECGLTIPTRVADVGSGTGILTRMLLEKGYSVWAVEPNDSMRAVADRMLSGYTGFHSVAGSAEACGLPDDSIELMIASHSFHWFDRPAAREEWRRILVPDGWAVLVWNERLVTGDPFHQEFERILHKYSTDYRRVDHRKVQDPVLLAEFFGSEPREARFDNLQVLDRQGIIGRVASASYAPQRGSARFYAMADELEQLFTVHASGGTVRLEYDTCVYYGRLD